MCPACGVLTPTVFFYYLNAESFLGVLFVVCVMCPVICVSTVLCVVLSVEGMCP